MRLCLLFVASDYGRCSVDKKSDGPDKKVNRECDGWRTEARAWATPPM